MRRVSFVIVSLSLIVFGILQPGSALAQIQVPPGSSAMFVWEPDASPAWVNGQPQGYAEGETAAMTVEVSNNTTVSQTLDVCIQVLDGSGKYGFVAFESWDTTVAPTVLPNGSSVSVSSTVGTFQGHNMTIASVTAATLGQGDCDPEYLGVTVVFNKIVGNDDAYFLYGGRLSQQGETLLAGLPDPTVPTGKSASFINGTFQSRITGGDETINFKGDYIEPDGCPEDPIKNEPGICGCGIADTDGDGDGIADCTDQCPNDAFKETPGICGCGIADTDSDGDGTADCDDLCVNDSGKTDPGVCGCGIADTDGDGDGIADCTDQCPNDALKETPGICGCGVADTDSDGDGTADCNDLCANDAGKTNPGICGCGVSDADNDGDGIADCNDQCPNDGLKTSPGQCGCGVVETDSDGDGTADCNDLCVNDSGKTNPGICGCGVSDADNDGDGIADCNDQCSSDALKSLPGICGCGVADTDSDGDGTADCVDLCVNDSGKTDPGVCGCGIADTDGDGDGIADCTDQCPNDALKETPGICGCGLPDNNTGETCSAGAGICQSEGTLQCDGTCSAVPGTPDPRGEVCSDNLDNDCDGVVDEEDCDGCPNDPAKTAPGQCGCGINDLDSDGDDVANCLEDCDDDRLPDVCEIHPELLPVEVVEWCGSYYCQVPTANQPFEDTIAGEEGSLECGTENDCDGDFTPDSCEPDLDGDGKINDCENCDSDPLKFDVGLCGCGVPDTNSDNDQGPDCSDLCPLDSAKVAPGACGCGVADTDSDGDGTPDCLDQCANDPSKTAPGSCGCGIADVDNSQNGVLDCNEDEGQCFGLCVEENPSLDEDEDGVSNCQEIEDETDPCDRGSFKERLYPQACAGPNGFFQQTNILTVINRQTNKSLRADVEYRDLFGLVKGTVSLVLGAEEKRDIIVNDLGLEPDTYGTVCVETDATKDGAWSGGLTLYKERFDLATGTGATGLSASTIFDYALYYPLTNPIKGSIHVPLNTNSLGTTSVPGSMIANWVRLTDAEDGDGKGLLGKLNYYDLDGVLVGTDKVALPDGGRFDFSGHDQVGQYVVGMAEFKPSKSSSPYYMESSRYVYEGPFVVTGNFWTAYVITNRPTTGVPTIGRISTLPNELAIVELINSTSNNINANFQAFDATGNSIMSENLFVPDKGSRHIIVTGSTLAAGFDGSAQVSGPPESIGALTLVYRFGGVSDLLLAYAPAFIEPIGTLQRTEFNSFIGHVNTLELVNSLDKELVAAVKVLNLDRSLISQFDIKLEPRATDRRVLTLPTDTYGTVVVDSGSDTGLVVRNDVSRVSEYTLSFPGQ